MRFYISIFCLLLSIELSANTYYVSSNGGNDNFTPLQAQDQNTPWRSINKVNMMMATFVNGDSVLFKGNEIFFGKLTWTKSGIAGNPIVIGSYNVGQAIFSGFVTLSGWATTGTPNVWQATPPSFVKKSCNVLTVDSIAVPVGRTPNSTYFVYQSATGAAKGPNSSTLTSNDLTALSGLDSVELVSRRYTWSTDRRIIISKLGSTVTLLNTAIGIDNGDIEGSYAGTPNYGFFLQRYAASLDAQNEWYMNATTQKMLFYSTVNPSTWTIKASAVDTLLTVGASKYITISNIRFEGAGVYAVHALNAEGFVVRGCSFNNNTRAVHAWNVFNVLVDNNYFNNSFQNAVMCNNRQSKQIAITNNYVNHTGMMMGMGIFPATSNMKALHGETDTTVANNFVIINNNTVYNCGHGGIIFQGSACTVNNNVIDSFGYLMGDLGGIYSFVNNQTLNKNNYRNRIVNYNFISNGLGSPQGANGDIDIAGLYLDAQVSNVTMIGNTIWNIPGNGLQTSTAHGLRFHSNTVYNTDYALGLITARYAKSYDNIITRNVLYQKTATQFIAIHDNSDLNNPPPAITVTESFRTVAYVDSNKISNLKTQSFKFHNPQIFYTLAYWRDSFYHDLASTLPPVTVTVSPSNTILVTNPTDTVRFYRFDGFKKIDPYGTNYNNSVNVPRRSSVVLINNGTITNLPPVANAGANQTITLPTSSTNVTGAASTDPDGSIVSFAWTKISGPTGGIITSPTNISTSITSLQQGTYVYQLLVTDNGGLTSTAFVQITVNAANVAPTANAGVDQNITLPTSTATLTGTATDPDGSIAAYSWVKISGPAGGNITSPTFATTGVTALQQGTYVFRFTATDNGGLTGTDFMQIVVNAANIAPTANAGMDQSITLPQSTTTLTGSGTDPDGTIVSYSWMKISGPTGGTIASSNLAMTGISSLQQGTYVYQLTVTDNQGLTGSDFVQVVVNAANIAPTANAGTDQSITLPTNSTTFIGSGTDPDGTIVSYLWTKISGPTGGAITSNTSATTGITGLTQGTYVYSLTVTDNGGLTGTDFIQVVVNPAVVPPNTPPTANAGADQSKTLPTNTATLTGSGNDPDGTIVAYLWTKISGPSGGAITSSTTATTGITGLLAGSYIYQLRVTDNSGDTATDAMQITVTAANILPTANAGVNQTITSPASSVTLTGSGTDPDGTITAYLWTKISGSAGGSITSPTSSTTGITGLTVGTNFYQLRVTDNSGDTATDVVQITVNAANIRPTSNAGPDQSITLPTNTATLTGSGTDPDGTITAYLWTKISGPSGGAITSATSSSTGVTGLLAGVYIYQLRVTDNSGDTATDAMQITVTAANILPTANAGADQVINLPASTTNLTGSGSDFDGSIVGYLWRKISGPTGGTITSSTSANTGITGLQEGVYIYQLRVTDNAGDTATDAMQITVNAALPNTPPIPNAGIDQTITLPLFVTTISGGGVVTTTGATITGYLWEDVAGNPTTGAIQNPTAATTQVTPLYEGTYQYKLTVTDSNGLSASDIVQITVLPVVVNISALLKWQ